MTKNFASWNNLALAIYKWLKCEVFVQIQFSILEFQHCCCAAKLHCPNVSTTPLRQWGFRQCLPFSWTTLRGKHCRHPIAVMGVVDTFGLCTYSTCRTLQAGFVLFRPFGTTVRPNRVHRGRAKALWPELLNFIQKSWSLFPCCIDECDQVSQQKVVVFLIKRGSV